MLISFLFHYSGNTNISAGIAFINIILFLGIWSYYFWTNTTDEPTPFYIHVIWFSVIPVVMSVLIEFMLFLMFNKAGNVVHITIYNVIFYVFYTFAFYRHNNDNLKSIKAAYYISNAFLVTITSYLLYLSVFSPELFQNFFELKDKSPQNVREWIQNFASLAAIPYILGNAFQRAILEVISMKKS